MGLEPFSLPLATPPCTCTQYSGEGEDEFQGTARLVQNQPHDEVKFGCAIFLFQSFVLQHCAVSTRPLKSVCLHLHAHDCGMCLLYKSCMQGRHLGKHTQGNLCTHSCMHMHMHTHTHAHTNTQTHMNTNKSACRHAHALERVYMHK